MYLCIVRNRSFPHAPMLNSPSPTPPPTVQWPVNWRTDCSQAWRIVKKLEICSFLKLVYKSKISCFYKKMEKSHLINVIITIFKCKGNTLLQVLLCVILLCTQQNANSHREFFLTLLSWQACYSYCHFYTNSMLCPFWNKSLPSVAIGNFWQSVPLSVTAITTVSSTHEVATLAAGFVDSDFL